MDALCDDLRNQPSNVVRIGVISAHGRTVVDRLRVESMAECRLEDLELAPRESSEDSPRRNTRCIGDVLGARADIAFVDKERSAGISDQFTSATGRVASNLRLIAPLLDHRRTVAARPISCIECSTDAEKIIAGRRLFIRMIDPSVTTGEHQNFMPVVVAHQIRRSTVLPVHLDHLCRRLGLPHYSTLHM